MKTQTPHDASMLVQINPNDSSDEPVAVFTFENTDQLTETMSGQQFGS
jgi:hypothetical protein